MFGFFQICAIDRPIQLASQQIILIAFRDDLVVIPFAGHIDLLQKAHAVFALNFPVLVLDSGHTAKAAGFIRYLLLRKSQQIPPVADDLIDAVHMSLLLAGHKQLRALRHPLEHQPQLFKEPPRRFIRIPRGIEELLLPVQECVIGEKPLLPRQLRESVLADGEGFLKLPRPEIVLNDPAGNVGKEVHPLAALVAGRLK